MLIGYKKLHDDAKAPTRAHPTDAGFDLYSVDDLPFDPGDRYLIDTGIALSLIPGYVGLICPRSGLAHSSGLTVLNAPGVIDAGYQGEVRVLLINLSNETQYIEAGDRIAQLLIQRIEFDAAFFPVREFTDITSRGENGFGSSGKK